MVFANTQQTGILRKDSEFKKKLGPVGLALTVSWQTGTQESVSGHEKYMKN
jgi:hypothetical protein